VSRAPRRAAPRRAIKSAPRPSAARRLLARLPIRPETLARIAAWGVLGVAGLGVAAAASWAGVPAMVGRAVAEGAGRAGLRVEQIEITGLSRMDRMSVYAVALEQQSRALALVDLGAVRERLLRYGWIADAQVSRRYPDTLLVHVVERKPAAVWQDGGQLTLIDDQGVLLEPVTPDRMPDLPLVIGPGADKQERGYTALLAAAPQLRSRVLSAAWVGNRRWDLTFRSGEVLSLPEDAAGIALARFARLESAGRLLGRGWKRFDMRDPARLVARRPGAEERRVADPGTPATKDTERGADSGAASGEV